jgi:hypothetical protein
LARKNCPCYDNRVISMPNRLILGDTYSSRRDKSGLGFLEFSFKGVRVCICNAGLGDVVFLSHRSKIMSRKGNACFVDELMQVESNFSGDGMQPVRHRQRRGVEREPPSQSRLGLPVFFFMPPVLRPDRPLGWTCASILHTTSLAQWEIRA